MFIPLHLWVIDIYHLSHIILYKNICLDSSVFYVFTLGSVWRFLKLCCLELKTIWRLYLYLFKYYSTLLYRTVVGHLCISISIAFTFEILLYLLSSFMNYYYNIVFFFRCNILLFCICSVSVILYWFSYILHILH